MHDDTFFQELLDLIQTTPAAGTEFPEENPELLLKTLWLTAMGHPCALHQAQSFEVSPLSEAQQKIVRFLVDQRIRGVPLAKLTRQIDFMGLELFYDPGVLIPRPETELLGKAALEITETLLSERPVLGIDVGCGCGNISCVLASQAQERGLRLYAIDIDPASVALTRKNVINLGLEHAVSVFQGDLFAPLAGQDLAGTVDLVVSNPPYIPSGKLESSHAHLLTHEPRTAFDGGIYGFSLHQRLLKESLPLLKPGGYLLFEFGLGQEKQIAALCKRVKGYGIIAMKMDPAGNPRVAVLRKPTER